MVVISESANEHKRIVHECLEKDFDGCVAAGVLVSARDALEGQIAGLLGTTSLYVVLFAAAWETRVMPQLLAPLLLAALAVQAVCFIQFMMIIRQADRTNPYGEKALWKTKASILCALHIVWAITMMIRVKTNGLLSRQLIQSLRGAIGLEMKDVINDSPIK